MAQYRHCLAFCPHRQQITSITAFLIPFFFIHFRQKGIESGLAGNKPQTETAMSDLNETLAWTGIPVPDVLNELPLQQKDKIITWAQELVEHKTDGFEDLFEAIGMIVKYIPHFIVIPLMVDHIKPRIAAGVCRKMSVDQATGYANDLPLEYFSEVSMHLESPLLAQILGKMRRHNAEKFIHYELQHRLTRMLDIATQLDEKILEIVAKHITLPEHEDDLVKHPHTEVIMKIRAMQK